MGRILFITGTDTGAGKTLLGALLLTHLRERGVHALGMKPFCSGGVADVNILHRAQSGEISKDRINPFYFDEALAPLAAARRSHRIIPLPAVIQTIVALAENCEVLLVEGAGGLLAPLGEAYTAADLIKALRVPVLLAAANKLGVINHTLLALQALRALPAPAVRVVLMEHGRTGLVTSTNVELLREWARPTLVFRIPFLGSRPGTLARLKAAEKKLKKTLAGILENDILSPASSELESKSRTARKKMLAVDEKEGILSALPGAARNRE